MTYRDYVEKIEYRERLESALAFARSKYDARDFDTFSEPLCEHLRRLNTELNAYERSASAAFSSFMGLKTFRVSQQVMRTSSTIASPSSAVAKPTTNVSPGTAQIDLFALAMKLPLSPA